MKSAKIILLILCGLMLCAGYMLVSCPLFISYDDVSDSLRLHSNVAGAKFFTPEYYKGVITRAIYAGIYLIASNIIILVCSLKWRTTIDRADRFLLGTAKYSVSAIENAKHTFSIQRGSKQLIIILLLGMFVRLFFLFQPISSDEARGYYAWTARPFVLAISDYRAPQHLLYTMLDYPIVRICGDAEWAIRLPAFVGGIMMIYLMYVFGRKAANEAIGLFGAAMVAIHPVLVHFSVNGRAYTLHICAVLLLWYAAMQIVDYGKRKYYGVLVGSGVLGLMALPTMIYPLIGTYLWIVYSQWTGSYSRLSVRLMKIKPLVFCGLVTIWLGTFAYMPAYIASDRWYSVDADDVSGVLGWSQLPVRIWNLFAGAVSQWGFGIPIMLSSIFIALFAYGFIRHLRKNIGFLCLFNLLGVILALLVLRVVPYSRTIMYLICPFVVFAGIGFYDIIRRMLNGRICEMSWSIIVFVIVGLLTCNIFAVYSQGFTGKWFVIAPGPRNVMTYLKNRVEGDDHIICMRPLSGPAFYYYKRYKIKGTLWFPLEKKPPESILRASNTVYVVVSHYGGQSIEQVLQNCDWPLGASYMGLLESVYTDEFSTLYTLQASGHKP